YDANCTALGTVGESLVVEASLFSESDSEEEGETLQKRTKRPWNYGPYATWRDLVLHQPHLHFNGVYVSRVDYGHQGGMSLDLKPMDSVCFNIRYYRVLKFHMEHRRVYMVTSAEEPAQIVRLLQQLDSAYFSSVMTDFTQNSLDHQLPIEASVKMGHFEWTQRNQFICRFSNKSSDREGTRRNLKRKFDSNATEIEMVATFEVSSTKHKLHNVLTWKEYTFIKKSQHTNLIMESSALDLKSEHFRPLVFSRVSCYTESVDELPLC
ncbi:hypothetical protein Ciccas_006537, partial [Cichlidogyrus casuarinus]